MTVGYMALPGGLKQLSLKGWAPGGYNWYGREIVTDTHVDTTQRRSGDCALKSMELASLGMLS